MRAKLDRAAAPLNTIEEDIEADDAQAVSAELRYRFMRHKDQAPAVAQAVGAVIREVVSAPFEDRWLDRLDDRDRDRTLVRLSDSAGIYVHVAQDATDRCTTYAAAGLHEGAWLAAAQVVAMGHYLLAYLESVLRPAL